MGSMPAVFGSVSPSWLCKQIKKELSVEERHMFDDHIPKRSQLSMMKWIHLDGRDDDVSVYVKTISGNTGNDTYKNCNDGDARDCAVCLGTQQEVGLEYKNPTPRKEVLLWHGEIDRMVSVDGAKYLEAMIPDATLTTVPNGSDGVSQSDFECIQ